MKGVLPVLLDGLLSHSNEIKSMCINSMLKISKMAVSFFCCCCFFSQLLTLYSSVMCVCVGVYWKPPRHSQII